MDRTAEQLRITAQEQWGKWNTAKDNNAMYEQLPPIRAAWHKLGGFLLVTAAIAYPIVVYGGMTVKLIVGP